MLNRVRLVAFIYFCVAVAVMVALWVKWVPTEQPWIAAWWIAEAVVGFYAFQALVAIIMSGAMKKVMKKEGLDF